MRLSISMRELGEILNDFDWHNDGNRMLLVGAIDLEQESADSGGVLSLGKINDSSDVDAAIRVDLAVVVNQLENMSKHDGTHLLARLRDLISERVLLILQDESWTAADLLALGYQQILEQRKTRPSFDGRVFLFDPNEFNKPREWNNTSNWANPGNFSKFRW